MGRGKGWKSTSASRREARRQEQQDPLVTPEALAEAERRARVNAARIQQGETFRGQRKDRFR